MEHIRLSEMTEITYEGMESCSYRIEEGVRTHLPLFPGGPDILLMWAGEGVEGVWANTSYVHRTARVCRHIKG